MPQRLLVEALRPAGGGPRAPPVRHVDVALEHLLLPLHEADVAGAVGRPHPGAARLVRVGSLEYERLLIKYIKNVKNL